MAAQVRHQEMPVNDFLKLKPVSVQRGIVRRANKLYKNIVGIKHDVIREVTLVEYPNGTMEVADGNTRAHLYREVQRGTFKRTLNVPKTVIATIHKVKDHKEAEAIYRSKNARTAAKSTGDDISGYLRNAGLNPDRMKQHRFANGRLLSTLTALRSIDPKCGKTLEDNTKYYLQQIRLLDDALVKQLNSNVPDSVLVCAFHIMKKQQHNNMAVVQMLNDLITGNIPNRIPLGNKWRDPALKRLNDVFNLAQKPWKKTGYNILDTKEVEYVDTGNNNNMGMTLQVGFAYFCIDRIVNSHNHPHGGTIQTTVTKQKALATYAAM